LIDKTHIRLELIGLELEFKLKINSHIIRYIYRESNSFDNIKPEFLRSFDAYCRASGSHTMRHRDIQVQHVLRRMRPPWQSTTCQRAVFFRR
jgi:hypothetical protein